MKNFFKGIMAIGMLVSAIASVIALIIFWFPMWRATKEIKAADPGVEEIPEELTET